MDTADSRKVRSTRAPYGFAIVLGLFGLVLGYLGIQLALLGGSLYYPIAAALLIGVAICLWRGNRLAAGLYSLLLLGTAVWGLAEVGFDPWSLASRLALFSLLALWFYTPWVRRGLSRGRAGLPTSSLVPATAGLVILGVLLVGVIVTSNQSPDVLQQVTNVTSRTPASSDEDWPFYGNAQGGTRYSPLAQITPENVRNLKVAWTAGVGLGPPEAKTTMQATPLKIGDRLFVCNGYADVSAFDAATGRTLWRHDAKVNLSVAYNGACRGVTYYRVPGQLGECAERIYVGTMDARLLAMDAITGRSCPGFGSNGSVNLLEGMGQTVPGYYYITSPPQQVRGKLIVGGSVLDGQSVGEPSGVIRAFDTGTGKLAWAWDLGRPGKTGLPGPGERYTPGTPNSWAPMSADEKLGLVYAPTGVGTPDYFGGHRTAEMDKYGSSVIALDVETGAVRWSYQTLHHDIWDLDVASQPSLVELPTARGPVPALIQPTKRGEIFVLDRRTGKPLVDTPELPVPQGGLVPGERLSKTQPFSKGMPSFGGPRIREADMWGLSPIDQAMCRIAFREARYDGPLTPPGFRPTLTQPGYTGGMDWGSASVDPERNLLIFPSTHFPNLNRILLRADGDKAGLKPAPKGSEAVIHLGVAQAGTPYAGQAGGFFSKLYMPCVRPPYSFLNAVDYKTGKLVWSTPFGSGRDMGPLGIASHLPFRSGGIIFGGAVLTRSGLTFIGATYDRHFRAFDSRSGKVLWQADLPASAFSTPMSYSVRGRQYVAVLAGGRYGMPGPLADRLIVYALPQK